MEDLTTGAPHLLELAFVDSINIRLGVKFISSLNTLGLEEMELRERFVCEDDAYNYPARHEVLGKNMENRDPI